MGTLPAHLPGAIQYPEHAMNGTPRLRSAYPSTPGSVQRAAPRSRSQDGSAIKPNLPTVPSGPATAHSTDSLIPDNLVSHPTQRLYATSAYAMLLVWCLYDWWKLVEDEMTSIGLFLKWSCIFAIYLYGLPQLQIPWLEWSSSMSSVAFFLHGCLVGMLMFRVPVSSRLFTNIGHFTDKLIAPP